MKIKVFWGRSENAVQTQMCVAICAYTLIAIMKKQLRIDREMHEILQILRVCMFDQNGLLALFSDGNLQSCEGASLKQPVFTGF